MTSVREELTETTGLKPAKKETPEAFRTRLLEAVDELDDKDYRKLSKGAKDWIKVAVKQANENGTVPDFDEDAEQVAAADEDEDSSDEGDDENTAEDEDSSDADAEDSEDADEDETEDEAVTATHSETTGSRRKAAAKSTAKKGKASKAKARDEDDEDEAEAPPKKAKGKNSGAGKAGGLAHARSLLAADPAMEVADLAKAVKKAGYNVSSHTLSTTASGFRAAVKALQDEGLLKRKLIG